MSSKLLLRALQPQTTRLLQPRLSPHLFALTRHASSSSSSSNSNIKPKVRVLEKPARFNPPSHPARLPRRQRPSYPGPPLSAKEKEAQKTKQYPHMMPPEGTFLHWFLTNRTIHVWITMSILLSLAFFTWLTNFLSSTPFRDQLPPNNMFLAHPFAFLGRYIEVYRLHTEYISAKTSEHRKQKVEDVRKRAEYRKAHGLDTEGWGGWGAKSDEQVLGAGIREGDAGAVTEGPAEGQQTQEEGVYTDFEGRKRPIKKWLGIW